MSSCARQSSARSIVPSARMSHSMPASTVMPSSRSLTARIARACARARAFVEAVGHRQRLAVIGDGDVAVARGARRAGHRLDVGAPVGRGRVHVEIAAQVGSRVTQARQRALFGRLDLAAVLAQLRRDRAPGRARVDPVLVRAGHRDVVVRARYRPYSFSLKPRWSARSRSAMLWAFEPVKYCSAAPRLSRAHQPQIGLEAAAQQHARLRLAVREDPLDRAVAGERVHHRRRRAGREDVEVAAGLAAAAQAADQRDVAVGRVRAERRTSGVGGRRALRPSAGGRRPARVPRAPCRISASFFSPMPLIARSRPSRAPPRGRRASGCPARGRAAPTVFGPDALQVEQVEDRGGNSCEQLLVVGNRAGLDELADLRGEVLADAGNARGAAAGVRSASRSASVSDGFRGVAVRANLERVLALDLEQVADLGQDAGDGEVVHGRPRRQAVDAASRLAGHPARW